MFQCYWYPTLNRCAYKYNAQNSEWLKNASDGTQITYTSSCPVKGTAGNNYDDVQEVAKEVTPSSDRYEPNETTITISKQ